MKNNNQKYNSLMRINHWILGLIIIAMLAIGKYMTSENIDPQNVAGLYSLHKSFGVIALLYIFFRIVVRMFSKIPEQEAGISKLENRLAKLGHFLLYIFMLALPVTGYVMSVAGGYGISFFGIRVMEVISYNPELAKLNNGLHETLGNLAIILVAIHVLAAVKHLIVDKVNIFRRII